MSRLPRGWYVEPNGARHDVVVLCRVGPGKVRVRFASNGGWLTVPRARVQYRPDEPAPAPERLL